MPDRRGRLAASLALALLLVGSGGLRPPLANAAEPLRWGSDAEGGVPYIFPDPDRDGRHLGYEVEIVEALGRELGRPIQFQQCLFDNLVPGLERGDFDFAMNGLEVTADRKRRVRFGRPYYVYRLQLVARADEVRFDSLAGVKRLGLVVGTLADTAADRLLVAEGFDAEHRRIYTDTVNPYKDLALGRIDAVLLDAPIALYNAKPDNPPRYATITPGLKFVGPPVGRGFYAIAFRKQDEALAQQFDAALERLLDSGKLRRIYEKWGLWNDDQEALKTASVDAVQDEAVASWSLSKYLPRLLKAAGVTVKLSVLSFLLAIALGLPVAAARLYGPTPVRMLAVTYIEVFRGIPVLFLLFFLYYTLPEVGGPKLDAFWVAVVGLGMSYAAYEAEVYRAAILSVPTGQWEAASSLGMPGTMIFRRIVLPQAVRSILPPATSDFVALFKDTSVVTVIALPDLMKEYQEIAKSSLKYLEVGVVTAVLYLAMSVPLGYLSRYLEAKWQTGEE
jgi:polar amino acid transport system substrate-binding protein